MTFAMLECSHLISKAEMENTSFRKLGEEITFLTETCSRAKRCTSFSGSLGFSETEYSIAGYSDPEAPELVASPVLTLPPTLSASSIPNDISEALN